MNIILRTKRFSTGIEIKLVEGDITLSDAEAITNPANSQLMHGGGLAGLLSRKAGPSFQIESSQWVKENGPVSHESPAHTSAGELPYKAVIHAVGPVWGSGDEERKLSAAVGGSLQLAEDLRLKSLALPAISTGIFQYPVEKAARVIFSAARDFSHREDVQALREIQIVVYGSQSSGVFQQIWDESLP
jgi:O-acetyl-ADP-ribose deacetylase (regulator of RNase III)